ncbi:MAG: hypothetical protein FJ276_30545 [Planctomycetes bacterium]|nr:hypothetical protein [Planctomycetota bacterium]
MLLVRDQANPPASRGPRNLPKIVGLGPRALTVLPLLMKHHKCEMDDGPCFVEMRQEDIANTLKCSQSTVSRAVDELLSQIKAYIGLRPMDRYKMLCRDHLIDKVLIQLANPRPREEFDGQDMDSFPS